MMTYIDIIQDFSWERIPKKLFSYFSTKTYVVGTQKNRLNETVLLSTQNIYLNWWVRKLLQFYAQKFCLSKPMIIVPPPGVLFLDSGWEQADNSIEI